MKQSTQNNWLGHRTIEIAFIISPSFLVCLLIIIFNDYFTTNQDVTNIWWIVLVMGIDVSHVYATLFRTYFNPKTFAANRDLYTYTPIICLIIGILLYGIGPIAFWRILAYLAVFHFMRQQYGFMRLYSRNETENHLVSTIDKIIIYTAVIYPILYWHTQADRAFSWFVEGDFLLVYAPTITQALTYLYFIIVISWLLFTSYLAISKRIWNIPKLLIIMGTLLSWYIGIVAFNGDLIFTCLNVVSHGIPYMALVWLSGYKEQKEISLNQPKYYNHLFKPFGIILFIVILLIFAYIEEGLWNTLVWRERLALFGLFSSLPAIENNLTLNILIPLLSLPQITHYVLDAFIWKRKVS